MSLPCDRQAPHLGLGLAVDVQMGEQGHAPVDHRAGSRHHDGAATARCHPVPLATVVALQSNTLILAHVMTSHWQDIVIDDIDYSVTRYKESNAIRILRLVA